jgi:hypothetical protein
LKKNKQRIANRRVQSVSKRSARRKKKKLQKKKGVKKFVGLLRKQSAKYGFRIFRFRQALSKQNKSAKHFGGKRINNKPIPTYGEIIKFLSHKYMYFSTQSLPKFENGHLMVPEIFSISENTESSMFFLKRLYNVLHNQKARDIVIDYKNCSNLDIDASACTDLILNGFMRYFDRCSQSNIPFKVRSISVRNYADKPEIHDILNSIGAYANLASDRPNKIKVEFEKSQSHFIPMMLKIGDKKRDPKGVFKEKHETEIVDYVVDCFRSLGTELTAETETHLSKVVGEVIANAEEHSKFRYRFAIGYFVKNNNINPELGIFKLVIFNFGQTIYQSFKKGVDKQNTEVVKQMTELSKDFTRRRIFKWKKYEEETLWTLYSLQEGVTSIADWKRGKGTIRFIDRFFKLKDPNDCDKNSKLTIFSGNTKIIFDGTYPLINDVARGNDRFQMMTFNTSGKIEELPDEKFVTFVPQTFPGTLITAKIYFTNNNIISNE